MESSGWWACLVMKLFKTIWCSNRRRAGRFNVHSANLRNSQHSVASCASCDSTASHLTGVIRHTGSEGLIDPQNSDLSGYCRSPVERRGSPTGSVASTQSQSQLTPSRQLSDGERLKKVILELVDTEKTYVKHLNNLLENYLEPLKSASFLSSAEVNALFGNIREIVAFQRLFLQALQEALDMEPGFPSFDHPYEFKNVLFSIGSAFLYYASQFKLYSSFCASHSKAQKVLHPSEGNQALQEFLASRNPRQQHSATLESYLIKPIQRILKYPLLLQQLKALTTPGSDEHRHLLEALKVMEKVAEHINEMQRIHEEYGAIFDHLFRQHQKSCKQVTAYGEEWPVDLSPGDLLYYGGVEWLNISDFLGKIKKGLELHAMCFVFKTAVVFLCKERLRQKKKLMVSAGGAPGKSSASEVEIIRYQVLIPVTEVQVRASSMKDMDSHFLWELIHLKSQLQRRSEKVYHLSNSTAEFRNAFLKTIRQIIRESVRNMSIPANKPSSSSSSSSTSGLTTKGNTNTLQPVRSAAAKKKSNVVQSATLQRHSAGTIDYDNLESYDNVPETQQLQHHHQATTNNSNNSNQQQQQQQQQQQAAHYDLHNNNFRTRSKTVSDAMDELSDSTTKSDAGKEEAGTRSEGEEEVMEGKKKATLGRTPNHLSLSTTSTLSTGSTGSMAKLIQASNQPSQYQPTRTLGSPVWKPRDVFGGGGGRGESQTLPRPGKGGSGREDHFLVYEEYGGNIYTSSSGKKDTDDGDDDGDDWTPLQDGRGGGGVGGGANDFISSDPKRRESWGVPAPPSPHLLPPHPLPTPHLIHLTPPGPPCPPPPPRSGPHVTVIYTGGPPSPLPPWTPLPAHLHHPNGHPPPLPPPRIHPLTASPPYRHTHTDAHRLHIHRPHSNHVHTNAVKIHAHRPNSSGYAHTDTAKVHIHTHMHTNNHVHRIHTRTDAHSNGGCVGGGVVVGGGVKGRGGAHWPGFPQPQSGVRVVGRGEEGVAGQGMTIDTLLQQLRALS